MEYLWHLIFPYREMPFYSIGEMRLSKRYESYSKLAFSVSRDLCLREYLLCLDMSMVKRCIFFQDALFSSLASLFPTFLLVCIFLFLEIVTKLVRKSSALFLNRADLIPWKQPLVNNKTNQDHAYYNINYFLARHKCTIQKTWHNLFFLAFVQYMYIYTGN